MTSRVNERMVENVMVLLGSARVLAQADMAIHGVVSEALEELCKEPCMAFGMLVSVAWNFMKEVSSLTGESFESIFARIHEGLRGSPPPESVASP